MISTLTKSPALGSDADASFADQDFLKQSATRINFIADKVLAMSLEMRLGRFRHPAPQGLGSIVGWFSLWCIWPTAARTLTCKLMGFPLNH